jgi:eukaryotic-like serine/threonine-protein kinase
VGEQTTHDEDVAEAESVAVETTDGDEGDPEAVTVHGDALPTDKPAHAELVQHGQSIGRYVVVDKVGSGSMGVVYRAFDPDLGRGLALKLVEVRSSRKRRPEEIRARLLREAQAIARVSHPNVVQVYDVGVTELGVYVAMEFVEGLTLKQWIREGTRPWREVVDVFVQAGRGLAAAHAAEIIHRDFKPDNVMIGRDGRIRVLDFGLARADVGSMSGPRSIDEGDIDEILAQRSYSLDQSLTARGAIVGTPAYMSPEQHLGGVAGSASDQFSYCVALWEALHGERPFPGETHAAIAFNMVHGKIRVPPSERSVPRWLQTIVRRGLSVQPEERFGSMPALLEALERDPSRKWRWVGAGAAVLATAATAVALTRAATDLETSVCGGTQEQLATVWSSQRRERIESAFSATELSFARATWEAIDARLAEYADAWGQARTHTCRATRVHREQSERVMDLKIACLDRRLADFDALLRVLETAQRDVVISAIEAARELESVESCARMDVEDARQGPSGAVARGDVDAGLRNRVTELKARVRVGVFGDALADVQTIAEQIDDIDDLEFVIDVLALRGRIELATGHTREARETWEEAFRRAIAAERHADAAHAATKLAFIVGHRLTLTRDGGFWARTADMLLHEVDDHDGRRRASLWSAEAAMALAAGEYDEAIALGDQLRRFWTGRDDPVELSTVLGNLATALRQKGEYDRAVELHQQALELIEAHYGVDHPETAFALRRHGLSLSHAKQHEAALEQLERSLALHRRAQGGEHMDVAGTLDGIGRVLRAVGRLDEALARHEEALVIWRNELGPEHIDVAISLMNVGYTLLAAQRNTEALARFEEANAIMANTVGPGHPNVIYAGNALAGVLLALGRVDDAREHVERVLGSRAIAEVDPTLVAESRFLLAKALTASSHPSADDRRRARDLAREARDSYATRAHHWKDQLAEIEAWLVAHPR